MTGLDEEPAAPAYQRLSVNINEESAEILRRATTRTGITTTEAVRRAIGLLGMAEARVIHRPAPIMDTQTLSDLPPRGDWLGEEIARMAAEGIPNIDNAGDGTVDGPGDDDL